MTGRELLAVVAVLIAWFGALLMALDSWADSHAKAGAAGGFWGTLPSAWDHPEPNYLVSHGIGEFWSVLTTVPVAGVLLTYQGIKYQYGTKIMRIYFVTCLMYTLAFTAHLTLQNLIFSTTVTAVMSNALLTFLQFSPIVHRFLESIALRGAIVTAAECVLVAAVATLPYTLKENGGVWTLFIVQSPGVFLATILGSLLAWRSQSALEKQTFRLVTVAGSFLSAAMVLSFVECNIGFEHGFLMSMYGFPWLHIAIHVFEQIGIYLFGVGVACLHELMVLKPPRAEAEVRWLCGCVPTLHCPFPPGNAALVGGTLAAEKSEIKAPPAAAEKLRGRPSERGGGCTEKDAASLTRRRRDMTPGVLARSPASGDS